MSFGDFVIELVRKVPFGLRTRIKGIPVLKQLQQYLLRNWLDEKEFVATISGGPAKGLVFPVQMPQDKLMWIGTWELDFAQFLQKTTKPGWICYDIGAYKGYFSGIMALSGAAEVFIFEPLPVNVQKIKNLISLNSQLPLRLIEKAVSNLGGTSVFKMMTDRTMGKLEESSFQKWEKEVNTLEVGTTTIDELVNLIPTPDLIKIDVEGAEELVLEGGMKTLKSKKPVLMIEVHSPEIGVRCYSLLNTIYNNIYVFETGKIPGNGETEICHYIACS